LTSFSTDRDSVLLFGQRFDAFPLARVVIADVFPDEAIEFPFETLTADQRTAMQTMCFPRR
jgi:hypothetical protein